MISSISLPLATRHLEPGESLSELLFGLIMTLTFTLGAGLMVQEGPDAVSDLLVATIGRSEERRGASSTACSTSTDRSSSARASRAWAG